MELARGPRLEAVLEAILGPVSQRWASDGHSTCDASCPDCLRSWDNRHLHSLLDWRLALDVAELASGRVLSVDRWLAQSRRLAEQFVEAYEGALEDLTISSAGSLVAISAKGRAAVVGHPLWRHDEPMWTEAQAGAAAELRGKGLQVSMSDVRQLRNRPEGLYRMLI